MSTAIPHPSSGDARSPSSRRRRRPGRLTFALAAIAVVILVVAAGVYIYYLAPMAPAKSVLEAGGFTKGAAVSFVYNGTNTFLCTPGILTFYPNATQASASTPCEVGAADQNAVLQYPEWVLVPAFAGLSIFGLQGQGATARGFPQFADSTLLTDCGAGGTPTSCPDHPTLLYSPFFASVESFLNISAGLNGYPHGVLPTPAHDHLLNTSSNFPNVQWGTIVVLVLDPNIWPDRATGICTKMVTSNLSTPTANCLTSIGDLDAALTTHSTAVGVANHGNPIWQTLGAPGTQVVIPGDLSVSELNNLDGNLYIPFAVQPGAPSSGYPT